MAIKKLSEYTENEFLLFVKKICSSEYPTEDEQIRAVLDFERLTEHPDGSDLIYYAPSERESTPEIILEKIKAWRAANEKPGFKIATSQNT